MMDLSLRDGHQSLFATRGRTEDMIPVAEMPWTKSASGLR
jgi:pyruvate carboxylase subunit B